MGYTLKSVKIIKNDLSQISVEREIKIRMENSEGKLMNDREGWALCLGGGCKLKTNQNNSQNV